MMETTTIKIKKTTQCRLGCTRREVLGLAICRSTNLAVRAALQSAWGWGGEHRGKGGHFADVSLPLVMSKGGEEAILLMCLPHYSSAHCERSYQSAASTRKEILASGACICDWRLSCGFCMRLSLHRMEPSPYTPPTNRQTKNPTHMSLPTSRWLSFTPSTY